jgi:hypothetical protein
MPKIAFNLSKLSSSVILISNILTISLELKNNFKIFYCVTMTSGSMCSPPKINLIIFYQAFRFLIILYIDNRYLLFHHVLRNKQSYDHYQNNQVYYHTAYDESSTSI